MFDDRILKKLKLNHVYYKMAKPLVIGKKYQNETETAMEYLQELRPNQGGTCIRGDVIEKTAGYDLAIIVAAYNVESYVGKCIENVLKQKTRYTYQVIVVDDGSTDGTGTVLDAYRDNEKIKVIHGENCGAGGARNKGLEVAAAKYITFLDADDLLADNAIENLLNSAYEHDADIVEGAYAFMSPDGSHIEKKVAHKGKEVKNTEELYGFPWGKIYKSELFQRVCFVENCAFEDALCRQILYPMAGRTWMISDEVYWYRRNMTGESHSSRGTVKSIDSLWLTMILHRDREKLGIQATQEYYEYILKMSGITYRRNRWAAEDTKKAIFTVYADFINRYFTNDKTQKKVYADLETAIRNYDYGWYRLWQQCH